MTALPAQLVALDRQALEEMAQARIDAGYAILEQHLAEAHAIIALLDRFDGDCDLEEDDPQGQCDEDGINTLGVFDQAGRRIAGPGCPIADPDAGMLEPPAGFGAGAD